jgi:hypothetical protein
MVYKKTVLPDGLKSIQAVCLSGETSVKSRQKNAYLAALAV